MWDERYNTEEYLYGKLPNDFLLEAVNYIPKGQVLCLAEGEGRNATFLARLGYEVTAVDSSTVAKEKALKLARESGVSVDYHITDIAEFDWGQKQWNGVVAIYCHLPAALRKITHASAVKALKPGGVFVLEAYTPRQLDFGTGGPKDPELLMTLKALEQELSGLEFRIARETNRSVFEGTGHTGQSAVVQIVGVKPPEAKP